MLPRITMILIIATDSKEYKMRIWHYSIKSLYKNLSKTLKRTYIQVWHNEQLVYLNTSKIQHYKIMTHE